MFKLFMTLNRLSINDLCKSTALLINQSVAALFGKLRTRAFSTPGYYCLSIQRHLITSANSSSDRNPPLWFASPFAIPFNFEMINFELVDDGLLINLSLWARFRSFFRRCCSGRCTDIFRRPSAQPSGCSASPAPSTLVRLPWQDSTLHSHPSSIWKKKCEKC